MKKILISIGLALLIFCLISPFIDKEYLIKDGATINEIDNEKRIINESTVSKRERYVRQEDQLVINNNISKIIIMKFLVMKKI